MKLTKDRIVDAGMITFAEHGYAGLSMRQVAERLGVHAGSLYYHVRNKEALLALLADRVAMRAYEAGEAALAGLGEDADWAARVEAQASALRHTLREHAGGPLLLAGSPSMLSPGALSLMERLLGTLRDAGVPEEDRLVSADLLMSYVTGFVLQEQAETETQPAAGADVAGLAARFPLTFGGGPHTADDMFRHGVRLLCRRSGPDRPIQGRQSELGGRDGQDRRTGSDSVPDGLDGDRGGLQQLDGRRSGEQVVGHHA